MLPSGAHTFGDFCVFTEVHCLWLQYQTLDGRQHLGGMPVRYTDIPPFTQAVCYLVLWQCMRCTFSCAAGQTGTSSAVSALPLLMALPYWVAGFLAPFSLQHALQGQKTMRQGSASNLSANLVFPSSPSIASNQSSGNTARNGEHVIFVWVALARESPTAGAT